LTYFYQAEKVGKTVRELILHGNGKIARPAPEEARRDPGESSASLFARKIADALVAGGMIPRNANVVILFRDVNNNPLGLKDPQAAAVVRFLGWNVSAPEKRQPKETHTAILHLGREMQAQHVFGGMTVYNFRKTLESLSGEAEKKAFNPATFELPTHVVMLDEKSEKKLLGLSPGDVGKIAELLKDASFEVREVS
jgi:hypothetical protein